jgi:hypothetical protein
MRLPPFCKSNNATSIAGWRQEIFTLSKTVMGLCGFVLLRSTRPNNFEETQHRSIRPWPTYAIDAPFARVSTACLPSGSRLTTWKKRWRSTRKWAIRCTRRGHGGMLGNRTRGTTLIWTRIPLEASAWSWCGGIDGTQAVNGLTVYVLPAHTLRPLGRGPFSCR